MSNYRVFYQALTEKARHLSGKEWTLLDKHAEAWHTAQGSRNGHMRDLQTAMKQSVAETYPASPRNLDQRTVNSLIAIYEQVYASLAK